MTKHITREQFMAYFRSDHFGEDMSPDDCIEIFLTSLKGSSDITEDHINELKDDYGLESDEWGNS